MNLAVHPFAEEEHLLFEVASVPWVRQGPLASEIEPLAATPRSAPHCGGSQAAHSRRVFVVLSLAAATFVACASCAALGGFRPRGDGETGAVGASEVFSIRRFVQLSTSQQEDEAIAAEKEEEDNVQEKVLKNEEAKDFDEPASEQSKCTWGRGNCNETKCCGGPGMQCYEQDTSYAQCRPSCTSGPDPTHWDGKKWSCTPLGERSPGDDICGDAFGSCASSTCCKDAGMQCFAKNDTYALCLADCVAGGPNIADGDSEPWSCEPLGERKPGMQAWVQDQCSAGLDNCVGTQCCKNAGEQCALQNAYYGNCMIGCVGRGNGDPWSCKKIGSRTPAAPVKAAKLAPWALNECSLPYEGCAESKCCIGMNVQCYAKNKDWGMCMESCTKGPNEFDQNETWSCEELGPRSYGVATRGFPSLYCFSLTRTSGYEVGLMQAQLDRGAGIFSCDDYSMLTADGSLTLKSSTGNVESIRFPGAPVVTSQDGTAGNTALFVHAWDAVIDANLWKNHSFTVKVDPDAVMIADRLRWHLAPKVGEHIYVLNCNKFPGPNYPMVYGALEVFANSAIQTWAERGHECAASNTYGEDFYMTRCMDTLGVQRYLDERVLGDNLCMGADCNNGWISTFHPFKDVASWEKCWKTATAGAVTA